VPFRLLCIALAMLVAALAACGADEPKAPKRCNGSKAACDKPLDQVVFPATHNSFAASEQPGWRFADQRYGIERQLDDGIRALLTDVHFGVADPARGIVRTDLRAEGADRNKVAQAIGTEALHVADRVAGRIGAGEVRGTSAPYLCHTLCELGAEPLDQELGVIKRFMDKHPDEVLVVIVEDYVPPATIEQAFDRAGLLRQTATLNRGAPLPTLAKLIEDDHRLVVLAEDNGGAPSWYLRAFAFIQDTPLGARRPRQLSCARYRGDAASPILMLNHWLNLFPPSRAAERTIGLAPALRRRIAACAEERGRRPGIVAVDFYEQTAVVRVARAQRPAVNTPATWPRSRSSTVEGGARGTGTWSCPSCGAAVTTRWRSIFRATTSRPTGRRTRAPSSTRSLSAATSSSSAIRWAASRRRSSARGSRSTCWCSSRR
jgi:hypothetical protein